LDCTIIKPLFYYFKGELLQPAALRNSGSRN